VSVDLIVRDVVEISRGKDTNLFLYVGGKEGKIVIPDFVRGWWRTESGRMERCFSVYLRLSTYRV
jgi:hypothetical protein